MKTALIKGNAHIFRPRNSLLFPHPENLALPFSLCIFHSLTKIYELMRLKKRFFFKKENNMYLMAPIKMNKGSVFIEVIFSRVHW